MTRRITRVLHVTEAFGGGVESCIHDYAAVTPEISHYVLRNRRHADRVAADDSVFDATIEMVQGHVPRVMQLSSVVSGVTPDVVHLHPSRAGGYGRLVLGAWPPIVYTPHAYPFLRRDVGKPSRMIYLIIERALAARRQTVAAVSDHEADLARRLGGKRSQVVVVPQQAGSPRRQPRILDGTPTIVGVGRLVEQKGFRFFGQLAQAARRERLDVKWKWVGGGEPEAVKYMTTRGVTVTGWQTRDGVAAHLKYADAYVHCAVWDGSPVAVFEAAKEALPILMRSLPAADGLDLATYDDVTAMVGAVKDLLWPSRYANESLRSLALARAHSPQRQRQALLTAYTRALDDAMLMHAV